ncbi:unnamed protein product [Cylicocyclus nassatus]|uniref:Uncharacterized protein n=1 Tax=Cylicocyclus nassatus TaxID=53992 RepID=A0AA36H3F5_CYLNA|nr:unnamed protein product [Cylicocyclus nassatus]
MYYIHFYSMFCLRRRNKLCSHSFPAYAESAPAAHSYPVQRNLPHLPPPYPIEPLSCPINYYPANVYGQGLEGAMNELDVRITNGLDGRSHYNAVRDSSIPPPPGAVMIQTLQPTAPPYPEYFGADNMHLTQQQYMYPRLSANDQEYADQLRAVQKFSFDHEYLSYSYTARDDVPNYSNMYIDLPLNSSSSAICAVCYAYIILYVWKMSHLYKVDATENRKRIKEYRFDIYFLIRGSAHWFMQVHHARIVGLELTSSHHCKSGR